MAPGKGKKGEAHGSVCFSSMGSEIVFELRVFLVFVLHGMFVMLESDLLRSWRLAVPHGEVWTGIEDVFFWFFAGIWTFILIFVYQDGILRLYMAAAMGLGGFLYRKSISRWIVKGIAGMLRRIIGGVGKIAKKKNKIRQKIVAKFVKKE